nr:glycosyltransferase [Jiella mangrovi]
MERLTVAPPGTDQPTGQRGRIGGHDRPDPVAEPPTILSIGTLIPRKDHATLVEGLKAVADLDWRCRLVGSKTADERTVNALAQQVRELDLTDRIELVGALPDVSAEYATADLFVLASRYEGYGMVFAEAMAYGLPIVFCAEGAPRDLVPASAGRRFEPGDATGLGEALRELLTDGEARQTAARAALDAGRKLPSWRDAATIVAGALLEVGEMV